MLIMLKVQEKTGDILIYLLRIVCNGIIRTVTVLNILWLWSVSRN